MRVGLGIIGWPPRDYWPATPIELCRAAEGWMDANMPGGRRAAAGPADDDALARAKALADTMPDEFVVDRKGDRDA